MNPRLDPAQIIADAVHPAIAGDYPHQAQHIGHRAVQALTGHGLVIVPATDPLAGRDLSHITRAAVYYTETGYDF